MVKRCKNSSLLGLQRGSYQGQSIDGVVRESPHALLTIEFNDRMSAEWFTLGLGGCDHF